MKTINVLAMDYGASNGRGVIGSFDGEKIYIKQLHRFPNVAVACHKGVYWDILFLFNELKTALKKCAVDMIPVSSIGIDAWGLDFGVLDSDGNLLGNPHSYRDNRVDRIKDELLSILSEEELYSKTGMYPLQIATLFQLYSMKNGESAFLREGKDCLFVPDLLSYFLTGNKSSDDTLASVSLLYSPFENSWIDGFFRKIGVPNLFPDTLHSSSVIGNVRDQVCEETGIKSIPVIKTASHDTASAIASVPAVNKEEVIYISCGTWSVVGTTVKRPVTDHEALRCRFNNEIGYDGEMMFVKNITGLWVLQECEKEWSAHGYTIDYRHMADHAMKSDFDSAIDIMSPEFSQPGDMNRKVADHCRKKGQRVPDNREEIYMSIIQGLVDEYSKTIYELRDIMKRDYGRIHIVGGGARNDYLCMRTAAKTGMSVMAGPYEAAATGNILSQLIALGELDSISEAKRVLERSFELKKY